MFEYCGIVADRVVFFFYRISSEINQEKMGGSIHQGHKIP